MKTTTTALEWRDQMDLRQSGIHDDDLIRRAGIYTESDSVALGRLLRRSFVMWGAPLPVSAMVFPYFVPGAREPQFYRAKLHKPPKVARRSRMDSSGLGQALNEIQRREPKYRQPRGVGTGIYFPPNTRESGGLLDADRTLYWTEGEKKALHVDQLGLACVGLPGVWTAHDKPHKEQTDEWILHLWIREHVQVRDREHVVIFDKNMVTNGHIRRAADRLAEMLYAAGATVVRFPQWPESALRNTEINGVDDLGYRCGEEAVRTLIESAVPFESAALGPGLLIPYSILSDLTLTWSARIVLGVLLASCDDLGVVRHLAARDIAKRAGIGLRTAERAIAELRARRLVSTTRLPATLTKKGTWQAHASVYQIPRRADYLKETLVPAPSCLSTRYPTPPAMLVWGLLDFTGPLSMRDLAEIFHLSSRTIRTAVGELVRHGAARRTHRRIEALYPPN